MGERFCKISVKSVFGGKYTECCEGKVGVFKAYFSVSIEFFYIFFDQELFATQDKSWLEKACCVKIITRNEADITCKSLKIRRCGALFRRDDEFCKMDVKAWKCSRNILASDMKKPRL